MTMPFGTIETLSRPGFPSLAYERQDGEGPVGVWLCGFKSDMAGTKAQVLAQRAATEGEGFLRFDYRGCGRSEGRFEDGTIGAWIEDSLAVIDAATGGRPLILIGSSMGAWIALNVMKARPAQVKALLLIAPAPDFTERLMWPSLPEEARQAITRDGHWMRPSAYGDGPYPITRALFEDGRRHLVLDKPLPFAGPVRILQGMADPDVPWRHALALAEHIDGPDVRLHLIKHGDHRLSSPHDLALLAATLDDLRAAAVP
jgi:hypothetical protein